MNATTIHHHICGMVRARTIGVTVDELCECGNSSLIIAYMKFSSVHDVLNFLCPENVMSTIPGRCNYTRQ